jgi:hypothetical protein
MQANDSVPLDVDGFANFAKAVLPFAHRAAGERQQFQPFSGQFDPPCGAVKQGHADLFLELFDLHADSGLRPVQFLRCLPKALVVGDCDEDVQQFEVDVCHSLFPARET